MASGRPHQSEEAARTSEELSLFVEELRVNQGGCSRGEEMRLIQLARVDVLGF